MLDHCPLSLAGGVIYVYTCSADIKETTSGTNQKPWGANILSAECVSSWIFKLLLFRRYWTNLLDSGFRRKLGNCHVCCLHYVANSSAASRLLCLGPKAGILVTSLGKYHVYPSFSLTPGVTRVKLPGLLACGLVRDILLLRPCA